MIEVAWKSIKDVYYRLQITSSTSASLQAGVTPFVTEVANSDDFFYPVREQTGSIGIVGEVSALESLMANVPKNSPVTLYSVITEGGLTSQYVAWVGYLQSEAFSQVWDKGPNDISIPVMSHLAIITSYNLEELGWLSFADFINRMAKCEIGRAHV